MGVVVGLVMAVMEKQLVAHQVQIEKIQNLF